MVLVVGATGYVGRYLCPYLVRNGYDVLALGRSAKVFDFFDKNGVHHQYFDINDKDSYSHLPESADAVIDLSACLAEHETPVERFFEVNTLGVYNLLEYCRRNNIKKFILSSSHKVYNDVDQSFISEAEPVSFKGDHSPYIISKIAAENFVSYYHKDFGIEGIILRLTGVRGYGEILGHLNTDGSYQKSALEIYVENALASRPIEVWGDQSIKRDHVYIKDVIAAFEKALEAKTVSGIFNIASGIGYSQLDEAKAISSVFGKGRQLIKLVPERQGLTRGYVYDISKADSILGWKPEYSDLVEMYKDYKSEWEKKTYHNYHFILPGQEPATI